MTAIYTWDMFTTLDGFGSYNAHGDWGGYWGKQGPEFLDRRAAQYGEELRLVLGAKSQRRVIWVDRCPKVAFVAAGVGAAEDDGDAELGH